LLLAAEFQDKEDSDSDSTSDEENSKTDHETETKNPQMTYTEYERAEKIWQSYQKQAKNDEDVIKYTLSAIYGGLSKSMQAQYAFHDTPASLWEELKRTKDPSNRQMDTSAADTYRALKIQENQSVPDYIKRIREVEDACTAAGETLHLGLKAQLKVRYRLDFRFAQTVMVLRALRHTNVIDAEKSMIDLWDGYKAALELNNPADSKTRTTANVTIGNPDCKRKHENKKGGKGKKSNAYSGKNTKCDKCPGSHNPDYDCNACWRCGSDGHLSKNCPTKSKHGGEGRSSSSSSSSNSSTVAATASIDARPKQVGWVPTSGLLNRN
ncbi:hypothetical protein HDU77_011656, partial [Chytriomyces hyalinus]